MATTPRHVESPIGEAARPTSAPREAIEYAKLAERFTMSGSYIKNAALRVAVIATDEESPITEALLSRSALVESDTRDKIV